MLAAVLVGLALGAVYACSGSCPVIDKGKPAEIALAQLRMMQASSTPFLEPLGTVGKPEYLDIVERLTDQGLSQVFHVAQTVVEYAPYPNADYTSLAYAFQSEGMVSDQICKAVCGVAGYPIYRCNLNK